jgi:hypothetical protein
MAISNKFALPLQQTSTHTDHLNNPTPRAIGSAIAYLWALSTCWNVYTRLYCTSQSYALYLQSNALRLQYCFFA